MKILTQRANWIMAGIALLAMLIYFTVPAIGDDIIYQRTLTRVMLVLIGVVGGYAFCRSSLLQSYFREPSSAYNLAIFRILFYGFVSIGFEAPLYILGINSPDFPWAVLTDSARVGLPMMNWYVLNVPISASLAHWALLLIAISSFLCMIGFRPRIFGWVFLVAMFYYSGIPNFFGKINHNHYILWFGAIMCFARSSDVLSVDRLLHNKGILRFQPLDHSRDSSYGLPLKLIGLLIGIIYFFPGFWKLWSSGLGWIFSDNLLNQMYFKWAEFGNYQPPVAISNYPLLYKAAASFTIMFELAFIFLVLSKKTRFMALLAGLLFHLFSWYFLRINFFPLVICYAAFIDWGYLLGRQKSNQAAKQNFQISFKSPVMITGLLLIGINIIFGVGKINSWPFSVFPTFDHIVSSETIELNYYVGPNRNKTKRLDKAWLIKEYSPEIYRQWENQVVDLFEAKETEKCKAKLEELSQLWTARLEETQDSFFIYYEPIVWEKETGKFKRQLIYATSSQHINSGSAN